VVHSALPTDVLIKIQYDIATNIQNPAKAYIKNPISAWFQGKNTVAKHSLVAEHFVNLSVSRFSAFETDLRIYLLVDGISFY